MIAGSELMRAADLREADLGLLEALQPPDWSSIIQPHKFYLSSAFCFPQKIMIDDEIVGIGTSILHADSAWLGHIIVHPGHRRKGIGEFITRTLMDQSLARGCVSLYLTATDVGEPLYKRSGFEVETAYLFYKDIRPFQDQAEAGFITAYEPGFKAKIFDLDCQSTGENRRSYLETCLGNAVVYVNGDELEGFYLPAAGEGLIQATNPKAGLALANLRFRSKDFSAFPADNMALNEYLENAGYTPFKSQKKMRFGKSRSSIPANMYSRTGGNLG